MGRVFTGGRVSTRRPPTDASVGPATQVNTNNFFLYNENAFLNYFLVHHCTHIPNRLWLVLLSRSGDILF